MPAANTDQSYGTVAKLFHWLTVILILTLIPLGMIANGLPQDTSEEVARKAFLFSMHKTLGITTLFVALLRIGWAAVQPKPGSLHPDRKVEHWAAETVHWLLYGSLLLVPLSGWLHHASTTGFAPIWWPFGQNLPLVPKSESIAAISAGLHVVFERVLVLALLMHVTGALKHHFVDRDATLRRMWFGRVSLPRIRAHERRSLPFVSALTAWCVAVGIGGIMGFYASDAAQTPQNAVLTDVASEWQVVDGGITFEITQLGNTVQGSFTEWTADIAFDPEVPDGKAGHVEVNVSIPSLKLGAVTAQAMGADFFDTTNHPTATFKADIVTVPDGYAAVGTLMLKGHEVPVRLPYSLVLDGDTASMQSRAVLNRLDFGIGTNLQDEKSLGFAVTIRVSVSATRAKDQLSSN